jgi:2-dehydropantoate 2-reductase
MDYESIDILGTGAIATFLAKTVKSNGFKVRQIGTWKEGISHLNSISLNAIHKDGISNTSDKLVIVARKIFNNQDSAQFILKNYPVGTPVLIVQNGVNNKEDFLDNGLNIVSEAMITYGCKFENNLDLTVSEKGLLIMDYSAKEFGSLFKGLNYSFDANLKKILYKKLIVNCLLNGMTAIHNVKNGVLLNTKYMPTLNEILNECLEVLKSKGHGFSRSEVMELVTKVLTESGDNISSTLSDVRNKRRTEIEYINGVIVQLGKQHGIKTPKNNYILKEVLNLES